MNRLPSDLLGDDKRGLGKEEDEFQSLLEKVRNGEALAIETLVERYQRAILRVVRARLGKPMRTLLDSMDIVQSVHRSLLIGLRQDKYSISIASPADCACRLDGAAKSSETLDAVETRPGTSPNDSRYNESTGQAIEQVPAISDSPSLVLAAKSYWAHCLSKLDAFDQQLVHLKLAGQNNTEAAQQLGRDPAFIRMRCRVLRRTLRESGCLNGD